VTAGVTNDAAARAKANAAAATSRPFQFGGVQNMTTSSPFARGVPEPGEKSVARAEIPL
jgi:hypothetical protein